MNAKKIFLGALIISIIGILIDILTHTLFTTPNETIAYFITKFVFFYIASAIFLSIHKKQTYLAIVIVGFGVSLLWGAYYNIFPSIFGYSPYGIALAGVRFDFTDSIALSGFLFGLTHMIAYITGAIINKAIFKVR